MHTRILVIAACCLLLAGCAGWTPVTAANVAVTLADWGQTGYGKQHGFTELNPGLQHASIDVVRGYFIADLVAVVGLPLVLPPKWSKPFEWCYFGWEGSTVVRNGLSAGGLRFNF
jgi:hypothetical protein